MTRIHSVSAPPSVPIRLRTSVNAAPTDRLLTHKGGREPLKVTPTKQNAKPVAESTHQGKAIQQNLLKQVPGSERKKKSSPQASAPSGPIQRTRLPWIPPGITSTTSVRATPENSTLKAQQSNTHNYVAQSGFELHESRIQKIGSIETTLYDAKNGAGQFTRLRSNNGRPELVRPQTKTGRLYTSLDSPGMGTGLLDPRLNRAQVGQHYRKNYRQQQVTKKQSDLIPVTYHAEVALPVVKQISSNLVSQHENGMLGKKSLRNKVDQAADIVKYKHSAGILPPSFNAIKEATKAGSERLAVGNREHRRELSNTFIPSTIVHPSELRTRSEQMEARIAARKTQSTQDRLAVNPKFIPHSAGRSRALSDYKKKKLR